MQNMLFVDKIKSSMRVKITPYAYVEGERVYMYCTCPKQVQEISKKLHRGTVEIYCGIFKNKRGVRMIEATFEIKKYWSFNDVMANTHYIYAGLISYLRKQK